MNQRFIDAGLPRQVAGALRRVHATQCGEHALRGVAVDLVPRRQQIELSGGRPVVGGPARQAERKADAAEIDRRRTTASRCR